MTRSQLPRIVQRLAIDIQVVQARLAAAEEHMRAVVADGYAGGAEGGPPSDVTLTGVEAAVVSRWCVEYDYRRLETALRSAADDIGRAIGIMSRYPPVGVNPADELRRARCDGEMDPTCAQLAVAKGKCRRCYDAWRAAHRRTGTAGG